LVLTGFALACLGLALAFRHDSWGKVLPPPPIPLADPVFTNTATARISAPELIASGGDASILECYACHDKKKKLELKYDADNHLLLPKAHQDLVYSMRNCAACHKTTDKVEMKFDDDGNTIVPPAHKHLMLQHGRHFRNNSCFNCHDPNQLNHLVTRDGKTLTLEQSTLLCASCHGPIYADWEAGAHGRISGYWDLKLGKATKRQCTSCHDPHAPAFPPYIPAPAPHLLHASATENNPQEHK
jgi:predicted CXXCH cytochrome family protein